MRAYRKRRRSFWLVLTGGITALVLAFTFAQLAMGTTPPSPTIDRCQSLFAGPLAKYPPAKRAYAQRVVQQCEAAREKPQPPKDPNYVPPPITPTVSQSSGIVESGFALLPPRTYVINNQWHGMESGMYIGVYAGSEWQDPTQGLVVVREASPDYSAQSMNNWLAPPHVGTLRIIAASGHILTLQAPNGARFTFDAVPACGMPQPVTTGEACQFVPLSAGK
jgi:hypothetical protein